MNGRVIVDIEGLVLTAEDRELISHPEVAGVILFARNFDSIQQAQQLTSAIKAIRSPFIIAVDHEGGRVQRFTHGFTKLPSMSYWGEQFVENPKLAKEVFSKLLSISCQELIHIGINFNLSPVLDVNQVDSEVIGERSISSDPDIVIQVASLLVELLHQHGLPAIGKHFPGHGGVRADSHVELPIDVRSWESLLLNDLKPFQALSASLDAIMPAHVIYSTVDSQPATFSTIWLNELLRGKIGYQGLVISDDLSMQGAVKMYPDPTERALRALSAGCDLILVCNHRESAAQVVNFLEDFPEKVAQRQKVRNYISNLM